MLNKVMLGWLVWCMSAACAMALDVSENDCQIKKLGWHFYCDPEIQEEPDPQEEQVVLEEDPVKSAMTPQDYLDQRDAVRQELEWKLARAVLYPTQDNIIDYIRTQRDKALEPSNAFTTAWRKAIWTTPDIDYTLTRPVNTVGNQAWLDKQQHIKASAVQRLEARYGIFFFYSSTCIYCQKYSPILHAFASKYHLTVMPISMDGGVLPQWPNTVFNQGQAQKMGMAGKPVPATLLYDKYTNTVVPVGYGLMAMDELEQRIAVMTMKEEEKDAY